METSDSEYFESADEDIRSDDETQIEEKKDAKSDFKSIERMKTLSIGDNLICNSKKEDEEVTESKEKVFERKKNKICGNNANMATEAGDNDFDNDNASELLSNRLPVKPECWEPGVNYDNIKLEDIQKYKFKRAEFGIPPAKVGGCSFPNKIHETKDNIDHTDDTPKFRIPPALSKSGVMTDKPIANKCDTLNYESKIKQDNSNEIKSINQEKQKRPEFGIPPARTTCWVPGVTDTKAINQSFQPHPAYLALKKSQNAESNMWDNDDWGDFDTTTNDNNQYKTVDNKQNAAAATTKKYEENPSREFSKKPSHGEDNKEENMWEDDDWEPIEQNKHQEKVITPQLSKELTSSWSDWSNWGLSTVLSTATTLTSQVSQGFSNVLESGIGAPDPEELARINKLQKDKLKQTNANEEILEEKPILSFGLGNLVHGVTKLVESTSTKVISGGLDTLETIGKKTMEVLQENDPGLKKKRAFLKLDDDKPILSHVLRDAKEKAERENKELEKKHFAKKANYETIFDDHQGLVHLEALEMLSKQCDIKVQSLLESSSGNSLNGIQETLDQVKELCELPEEEDEESLTTDEIRDRLESAVSEININITYKKLLTTCEEVEDWLSKVNVKMCNKNELHQQAIESLAQLTALAVEQFHKAGELLLVKEHRSTADEADSLVQLTTTLTALIGIIAGKFSEKLNVIAADGAEKEEVNSLITNVFFEAANSSSYIQDAFQLLMPVLQVGAV